MTCFSHYMRPIIIGTLVVLDHPENTSEENEKNIEEVNENFILMEDNLSILKKVKKKKFLKISLNGWMSLIEDLLKKFRG